MNDDVTRLRRILADVARGTLEVDDALAALELPAHAPVGAFARVDHDRQGRCGVAEVVFCQGKEPDDAAAIAEAILERSPRVLLTRCDDGHVRAMHALSPDAVHHARARCITVDRAPLPRQGAVALLAAGTADLPVAEEARVTLEFLGNHVETFVDVGVAGLHRLHDALPALRHANAVVVVAGMDGALPSVVGGLVDRPVVAVPTSVGYGAAFGGLAPLLTMLNSCAAGVGVVNIDNGFGAGYLAASINRLACAQAQPQPEALP